MQLSSDVVGCVQGISFRAAHAHSSPRPGDGWEMLRPRWNGTGRAATHYLFDGEWSASQTLAISGQESVCTRLGA